MVNITIPAALFLFIQNHHVKNKEVFYMIKMTMHHGEEVQQRDLPCDFLSLKVSLYQMNIMRSPSEVSVQYVQAEFTSFDPLGQKLIGLIRPSDTLADVDVAVHQIKAAPQPIQSALGQMLMDGSFETIGDIQSNRDRLLEELCGARQRYYFPLSCTMEDEDGELYESDAGALASYSEQIQEAIEQDQARDIDTMAMYFWCIDPKTDETIKNKLLTIRWGVEEIRGQLYGCVEVTSTAPLNAVERMAMREWISGQNSDGLGEGFEQRPIETDCGDIYIHFWNAGEDYFIATEDELDAYTTPSSQGWGEMQM